MNFDITEWHLQVPDSTDCLVLGICFFVILMIFSMTVLWSGQKTAEVEELKLRQECKENIYKLDDKMVKLLTSLDAMHATAEILLRYLNISDGDTDEKSVIANQNIWERKAVAARLLIKIERIVCTEKQDIVSTLSTFLHLVIFKADKIFKADLGAFNTLKLDAYRSDSNDLQCTEDHYVETIQRENKTLTERNAILQKEIKDLKSRFKEKENNSREKDEHGQNELTKLKAKVTTLQKQNNELKAKNDSQSKQLVKQEAVIKGLEKNKNSLQNEVSTLRSKCNAIEKQNDSLTFQLNQVTQEKEALDKSNQEMLSLKDLKITKINAENSSLLAAIQQNEESIAELEYKIEETVKETELQHKTYDSKLNKKDKDITELRRKLSNFEQQIRNKESIITKYESEKTTITEENMKLHMEKSKLSACLMNTEKENENLRGKVNEQNVEMKNKKSELQALREEINRKEEECDEKNSQIITLANKYEEKNNELIKIMSKKTIQVQVYGQRSMGWTAEIEKELVDYLKTEMKSVDDKLELSFFKVSRPSDVLPDIPLLLICVTISRLGTDVINATQGLALAPNMALTIFHHKDEHALPNQASERVLTAKELRGAGGIFDMAFKSDKGIYSCDMNVTTISSLITFIRRQAT